MPTGTQIERVRARLLNDMPYFAQKCLKIVNKKGQLVPLEAKPGQLKLEKALDRQRKAGRAQRVIVLKARQTGVSTWVQGRIIQKTTQIANRRARIVAHDDDTASELSQIGTLMHDHLPAEVKPPVKYGVRGKTLEFGERGRYSVQKTGPGYNSRIRVDTASDTQGGRGHTIHDLHLSEYAFWKGSPAGKMLSLLNAVPDEPDTMVIVESTADGHNHFYTFCEQARKGENDFELVFIGWQEEPSYSMPFASETERERFEQTLGEAPFGEQEPDLLELGCTFEQLNWRRWAIANKCGGSLDQFKQEYPSNPHEAFLASGSRVYEPAMVQKIIERCQETDPRIGIPGSGPEKGSFDSEHDRRFKRGGATLLVPGEPVWRPISPGRVNPWKVWEHPFTPDPENPEHNDKDQGRYVIGVDVSGGESEGKDEPAWHAINVINHRTREQCATYRSRIDSDLLAREVYLAARYWNDAWLAIEITGGWGVPVARIIRRDYHYAFQYRRKKVDRAWHESSEDRLGFDTNRITRPLLIESGVKLVRAGMDGIKCATTVSEMLTFVRDDKGRVGPDSGAHDDLLMSWMIAQFTAQEMPLRREKKAVTTSTYSRRERNPVTGY